MTRSTVLHVALAILLLGGCGVAWLTIVYSKDGRKEPAAEPSPTVPQPTSGMVTPDRPHFDDGDPVQRRIYADYGAVFVARNGAVPPPSVMFASAQDVSKWQAGIAVRRQRLGKYDVELQAPAMEALLAARVDARAQGLDITARAADASRRDYDDTVKLWSSRVEPALRHWVAKKRLTDADARRIRALEPVAQVAEVLSLEADGVYFSTDFSKSILYSVAAPGTSQHLSMLALDVAEFGNAEVRACLARHGWFQTVVSDLPHFTYLGVQESELPSLGLKRVVSDNRVFWIPDSSLR